MKLTGKRPKLYPGDETRQRMEPAWATAICIIMPRQLSLLVSPTNLRSSEQELAIERAIRLQTGFYT